MPKFSIAESEVKKLGAAGFVVIHDGRMIAHWGDISMKVNVASVRKSLLSALYGIAVAEGKIRLDDTLAELGIDDKAPALTQIEKQAKVVDLLKARSGIYHPAAYETAVMTASRPVRDPPRLAQAGTTIIGISMLSVRSTARQPVMIYSQALRST